MTEAAFKKDLLKFAGINANEGTMYLRGNIRMLGNGSFIPELSVSNLVVTGNAVIPGIQFDSLTVAGNVISTNGNFIGNGALMTGVTSTLPTVASLDTRGNIIGNYANVDQVIAASGNVGNTRFTGGNVAVSGQINTLGNVVAPYFVGDSSRLTGIANIDIRGNVAGNVIGNYANVDQFIATSGNVGNVRMVGGNVAVSGQINTLGNVVAPYFIGGSSRLTGIANIDIRGNVTGNVIGNYANVDQVIATSGNVGNVRMVGGNVAVSGQINTLGNVVAPFFVGDSSRLTGIANIDIRGNVTSSGNVIVAGQVNVTGNVAARYFLGNGALLEGVATALPSVANIDIRGNVTAPGNVSVAGKLDVTGNVTADYYFGNIAFASGGAEASIPSAIFADVTGNVTAPGNVIVAGQVNVTGNVAAGYFRGNGALLEGVLKELPSLANTDIRGNVTAPGNVIVAGQVNVTGNVAAGYFLGNGALLEGVATTLPSVANIDIRGNVTAPGNVSVAGKLDVVGNVTADYYFGNGALLSGVPSTYTANGSTITTSNLIITSDKYFAINASNTSLLLSAVGVNTGGNLTVLGNNGYISQNNLNGYLLIPQGYVQDEANRLALGGGNAPIGTFVTQADNGNSYILTASPSNISNSWLTFTGANFPVNTVFGRTGDIISTYADYTDALVTVSAPVGTTPAGNSVAQALKTLQSSKANIDGGAVGALFLGNLIGDFANVTTLIGTTGNVGNVLMAGGNVNVSGQINTLGNVVAPFFVGNGSQLSGVIATLPLSANIDIKGNVIGVYANVSNLILTSTSIALGFEAGLDSQQANSIAIGHMAGKTNQGNSAVAVGFSAGEVNQQDWAVAVGLRAGTNVQGNSAVAVGLWAGYTEQGSRATAVGPDAGQILQGNNSVAVGSFAGQSNQGANSVAIGLYAGHYNMGNNSVAIGAYAKPTGANTIILNASGEEILNSGNGIFIVKPVRGSANLSNQVMLYDTTVGEVTYNTSGNLSANYFIGNGSQLTDLTPTKITAPGFRSFPTGLQIFQGGISTLYVFDGLDTTFTNTFYNATGESVIVNGRTIPAYAFSPDVAGFYSISATSRTDCTGEQVLVLYKNGQPYANGSDILLPGGSPLGINFSSHVSTIMYLNGTTDFTQSYLFVNPGCNAGGGANNSYAWFSGLLLNTGTVVK